MACVDELKQNGFEVNQAKVLAMAIDETVGDRLDDLMSRIDASFDAIDAQFRAIEGRFEGINAKLDSRKYEIVVHMTILSAAIGSIGMLIYDIFVKPLMS